MPHAPASRPRSSSAVICASCAVVGRRSMCADDTLAHAELNGAYAPTFTASDIVSAAASCAAMSSGPTAVRVQDLRGHALRQHVHRRRQRRRYRVTVHVDEPRRDDEPRDIDHRRRGVARQIADLARCASPATPTSARYAGRPVPSSTDPPRRMRSNAAGGGREGAVVVGAAHAARARSAKPTARACMPAPEYRANT